MATKPASASSAPVAAKAAGDKLKVLIIIGSVKENRLADRVVKFVQPLFEKKNFHVDILGKCCQINGWNDCNELMQLLCSELI